MRPRQVTKLLPPGDGPGEHASGALVLLSAAVASGTRRAGSRPGHRTGCTAKAARQRLTEARPGASARVKEPPLRAPPRRGQTTRRQGTLKERRERTMSTAV